MISYFVSAPIAAALFPVAASATSNLVTNGSFEQTPALSGWSTYYGFNAIPGWSAGPAGIEVLQSEVTISAQTGTNVVALHTFANSYIWQEISTVPVQAYELSFYFSPRPACVLIATGWFINEVIYPV